MLARWALLFSVACGPIYSQPPPPPPPQPQPTQSTDPPSGPADPAPPDPAPAPIDPDPPVSTTPKPPGPPKLAPGSQRPTTLKTQAEIAMARNWDGEQAYKSGKYADASGRFREAVARVPEGRYFYNLCASLYQEGKFSEALTACNAVSNNNPSAVLQKMADELTGWIKDEARVQRLQIAPP